MKVFQLKASRAALNLSVKDLGSYIGVSGTAISNWENEDVSRDVNTSRQNVRMLEQFFMIKNLLFPNLNSVLLNESNNEHKDNNSQILTRFQLRGGRAILGINRSDLASLVKIDQYVIARAERLNNSEYIRPQNPSIPEELKNIFTQHGVIFPSPFIISIKNS